VYTMDMSCILCWNNTTV